MWRSVKTEKLVKSYELGEVVGLKNLESWLDKSQHNLGWRTIWP